MTKVSLLNGNVVVIRPDYITHKPLISFIGTYKTSETTDILLADAHLYGAESVLHNVPIESINELSNSKYTINDDVRHRDYILDTAQHTSLQGSAYASMRSKLNKFKSLYEADTKVSVLPHTQNSFNEILSLFDRWQESSRKTIEDTAHERTALIKILNNIGLFKARITGVYIADILVGITINSPQNNNFEMGMFLKFDYTYARLFEFLVYSTAKIANAEGFKYINFQQDLGIPSLRSAKLELHPSHFFDKYTVSKISSAMEPVSEIVPEHNNEARRENLSHA